MSHQEPARECVRMKAFAYENGTCIETHRHRRGQLIYALSGMMDVCVENRQWRVPPQRAVWMPPRTLHSMRTHGAVELRTVYIPADMVPEAFLEEPMMIAVSALLRELILRGIDVRQPSPDGSQNSHLVSLVVEEMEMLLEDSTQALERSLPLPSGADKRISKICGAILDDPAHTFGLVDWAREVGASKRTLARRFQSEFGMSFVNWRQQVRLVSALSRLDEGEPVTVIALDLGYETPAAFSLMFRRLTGMTPSRYAATTESRNHAAQMQNSALNNPRAGRTQ